MRLAYLFIYDITYLSFYFCFPAISASDSFLSGLASPALAVWKSLVAYLSFSNNNYIPVVVHSNDFYVALYIRANQRLFMKITISKTCDTMFIRKLVLALHI